MVVNKASDEIGTEQKKNIMIMKNYFEDRQMRNKIPCNFHAGALSHLAYKYQWSISNALYRVLFWNVPSRGAEGGLLHGRAPTGVNFSKSFFDDKFILVASSKKTTQTCPKKAERESEFGNFALSHILDGILDQNRFDIVTQKL